MNLLLTLSKVKKEELGPLSHVSSRCAVWVTWKENESNAAAIPNSRQTAWVHTEMDE